MPRYFRFGKRDLARLHMGHSYINENDRNALLPAPILTSPNGSHYRLRVADDGTLSAVFVDYGTDVAGMTTGTGRMSDSGGRLISTSAYAFKGDPMYTEEPLTITALRADIETVVGGTYKAMVITGDTVIESVLGESGLVTGDVTGLATLNFPMSIAVPAGRLVVLVGRTDGGDGYVLPVDAYDGVRSGFSWLDIPAEDVGSSCSRIAVANPVVGSAIDRGKGYNAAPFNIKVDWTR